MDPVTIMAIINGLVTMAINIWKSARQVYGEDKIPEWGEILKKNSDLADKIDAVINQ